MMLNFENYSTEKTRSRKKNHFSHWITVNLQSSMCMAYKLRITKTAVNIMTTIRVHSVNTCDDAIECVDESGFK